MQIDLKKKAMLCRLSVCGWSARIKSREAQKQIRDQNHTRPDAVAVYLSIIDKKRNVDYRQFATLQYLRNSMKRTQYKYSLPWTDNSLRLLPSAHYMDYARDIGKLKSQYTEALDGFINDELPRAQAELKDQLGKLAESVTLPTPDQIRRRFKVIDEIYPLADGDDIRLTIPDDQLREIQTRATDSYLERVKDATYNLFDQLRPLIERIATTLKTKKKGFHGTLLTNLREFVDTLPAFNLTDDGNLEEIRQQCLDLLETTDIQELRENKQARKESQRKAQHIQEQLEAFGLE